MTLSYRKAAKWIAAFLIIFSGLMKLGFYIAWRTPAFAIPKENVRALTAIALSDSTPSAYGEVYTLIKLESASDSYLNSSTARGIIRIRSKGEAFYEGDRIRFEIKEYEERVRVKSAKLLSRSSLALMREMALSSLSSRLPEGMEGELLKSLLLGLQGAQDSELKVLSRESGMAHIMALSGLHLAFFSFLFALVLKPVFKDHAPFLSLFPLFFYLLFIGPKPSLVRAFLLRTVFVVFHPIDSRKALLLTFFLQASLFPDTIGELSSLYSYLALFGIIFLSPLIEYPFGAAKRILRLFTVSYAAIVMTSPLSYSVFKEVRTGALFLSFLTTPLLFIIMARGILVLFFPSLSSKGGYSSRALLYIMRLGTRFPVIKERKGLFLFLLPLLLIFITSGILFLVRKKKNVEPGLRKSPLDNGNP